MKNKWKKMMAALLAAAMAASLLAGCGSSGKEEEKGTGTKSEEKTESSGDKLKIAFIPQLIGIPYFTAMEDGGNKAAEDLGVEFLYTGATQANAAEQVKIMDSLIKQGVNAMSLSVLDSSSTNPYIEKAQEAGIHVYTSDSDAPDSTREFYVAQALDEDLGRTLMDRLAAQIGEKGQVGIVSGESTATNLNTWISYMEEQQKNKYPDIEIVDIRYTQGGSSEQALKQAQELMTRYPDLKGLVAVASSTIPGVAQAVQQEGKAGEVKVIGYGSPATVKPFIDAGVMEESILWDAYELGYLTVWAGKMVAEGKEFEEVNEIEGVSNPVKWDAENKILLLGEPLIITKDNVDDFDF
ncbi:autoinducer 2 ABC transporter substrate-binding protein [Faecalicatena contorta]|uniref:Monosaccharide ABC transporter substrate-binding protein, CUT2 family n=1 Tax=Faecalicatena contorta TaxID=39482 RepID=A0A315ZV49_9FIRM|nr:autoinducer 2 ABC transporter substrate-binding protein [Faecalicatena contorta]PWJ48748.1 monosaccharide ABC transporter substrate-binding protein (CUT2 family) [Faecalicatena contorta]SUQ15171.1 monosaccharide ABC transporter substrate-binding protein, CUT2 family [Faecalicatena contorta]